MNCLDRGLGDNVEVALTTVGITPDRVSRWLGDCKCEERKIRLNQLSSWAYRVLQGKLEKAMDYLEQILD